MGIKKVKLKKPKVFDFHDYRQFLEAWLDYQKTIEPGFSLRKLSFESGISVSYLSMILKGERKLNAQVLNKLKASLNMSEGEFNYLTCLQILSDSDSQEERLAAIQKMQRYGRYKNQHTDEVRFYRYLSKWFNVAIKEMADLKNFRLDITWIQKNLVGRVPREEIRKAVEFLLKEGFIVPDKYGGFEAGEKNLKCEGKVFKLGLSAFHKQMFKQAIEAIDNAPASKRWLYGNTISISQKQFAEVVEVLQEANEKIKEIEKRKESSDVVYHTGFLAFPLTKR